MTPNQILDKIVKTIEAETDRFDAGLPDAEKRVFDRVVELAKDLKVKNGKLENSVENIRAISKLSSEIEKMILDPKYKANVENFTKAFEVVTELQKTYFSALSVKVGRQELLKAIQKDAVGYTVKQLTEQGVARSVSNGIDQILRRNVTSGGSFSSMLDDMKNYIVSGKDENGNPVPGAMRRYARQITTDSLNQYSATYNETVSGDLGFKWRMYTGSLLETSRPWCKYMVEKKYVHQSELQTVISDNIDGVKICSVEIPCSKKTGLPNGMIEGTNASNVAQRRGGWQCGHQFGGVPDAVVPKELRDKILSGKSGVKNDNTAMPVSVKQYGITENKTQLKIEGISERSNGFNDIAKEYNTSFIFAPPKAFFGKGGVTRNKFMTDNGIPQNSKWMFVKTDKSTDGFATLDNKLLVIKHDPSRNYEAKNLNKEFEELMKIDITDSSKYDKYQSREGYDYLKEKSTGKIVGIISGGKVKPFGISELENNGGAATVTHEQGHVVHNKYDPAPIRGFRPKLIKLAKELNVKLQDAPTIYGETNWSEFWAESFTAYTYTRSSFKKHYPKAFDLFEAAAKSYGIDLKTIKEVK